MTSSTTITIEVSPPPVLDRNGVIVSYRVSYRKEGAEIDDVMTMDFLFTGEDPQRLTLTGLDPGSAYMYSVQAATAVGAGQESFNRSFTTAGEGKSLRTTAATHTVTCACLLASVPCSPMAMNSTCLLSFLLPAQSVVNVTIQFLQQEYRVTESEGAVSVRITIGTDPLASTPVNLTIAPIDVNTTYRALGTVAKSPLITGN